MRAQIKAAREAKNVLAVACQALISKINDASTSEADRAAANTEFDAKMEEVDRASENIARMERALDLTNSMETELDQRAQERGVDIDAQRTQDQQVDTAFRNYLVGGMQALNEGERDIIGSLRDNAPRNDFSSTPAEGGITIPTTTVSRIEDAMLAYGGVRLVADTSMVTESGNPIILPTANDTAAKGRLLTEKAVAPQGGGTPFSNLQMGAWNYTSDVEPVSFQLIQDSGVDIQGYIGDKLGERLARGQAEHYISGSGVNQPTGLMTAATLGRTAALPGGVSYEDLVELEHSIDGSYRKRSSYLIGDGMLKVLRKMEDNEGRPLWQPSLQAGTASKINGHDYEVDFEIDAPATGAKSMLFGDMKKFKIRSVRKMVLFILREKYAESYQVGLVAFHRTDSKLLDAGTNPVKFLQHA